jgi:hypothetical protein
MTRRIWIVAALLTCFGTANAQRTIELVEESYELDVAQISFPGAPGGSVTVTPCDTCKRVSHKTTEQTVFKVDGKPTPYEDFLKVVEQRRNSRGLTYVGVHYLIETKVVTRIELKVR